jgi:uncharacterized membrane-anchored protein
MDKDNTLPIKGNDIALCWIATLLLGSLLMTVLVGYPDSFFDDIYLTSLILSAITSLPAMFAFYFGLNYLKKQSFDYEKKRNWLLKFNAIVAISNAGLFVIFGTSLFALSGIILLCYGTIGWLGWLIIMRIRKDYAPST